MPATRKRQCRRSKNQKGGGEFDSFCPFCHYPLFVPTGTIMHNFEDAAQQSRIQNTASWMGRNLVVDFAREDIYLMGPVTYGSGMVTRPRIGDDGEFKVNNSGQILYEEVEYNILNNNPDAEEPNGYGFHLACFRELAKLFEAAGYEVRKGFFGSFYPVEFEECLGPVQKQLFGDGADAPIDITNEAHYNPPETNPVFKQIFLSCPTIDLIAKIPEMARQARVAEAEQAKKELAPMRLPPNVISRIGDMFLKKGNLSSTTEALVGGGAATPSGGAGKERRRQRKTRRQRRH